MNNHKLRAFTKNSKMAIPPMYVEAEFEYSQQRNFWICFSN